MLTLHESDGIVELRLSLWQAVKAGIGFTIGACFIAVPGYVLSWLFFIGLFTRLVTR